MEESILPRMTTKTQDIVLGGLKKSVVEDRKMTIVLGEPGEGKSTTILDFCSQNSVPSYYYRCSPITTMRSLLIFMANAVGAHPSGRNDEIQEKIQAKLKEDNNYCFAFDEVENIISASGAKIDVIRQIYDSTNVQMLICGTYAFKDLICGERKSSSKLTHNRPQILRRLRKEEFERITEREIYDYLTLLETSYAVTFDNNAKISLVSTCRDRQSGGLGNFIEIIELIFSYVRPEWKAISYQMIETSGRILHTRTEEAQSFTGLKPQKEESDEIIVFDKKRESENGGDKTMTYHSNSLLQEHNLTPVDVSKLSIVRIDLPLIKDAMRHKVTM